MQNSNPTAGLVKVINPKNPDEFLWADAKQIREFNLQEWGTNPAPAEPAVPAEAEGGAGEGTEGGEGGADPKAVRRGPKN